MRWILTMLTINCFEPFILIEHELKTIWWSIYFKAFSVIFEICQIVDNRSFRKVNFFGQTSNTNSVGLSYKVSIMVNRRNSFVFNNLWILFSWFIKLFTVYLYKQIVRLQYVRTSYIKMKLIRYYILYNLNFKIKLEKK